MTTVLAAVAAMVMLTPGVAAATPYAYPPTLGPAAGNCYASQETFQGVPGLYVLGGDCGAFTQGVIAEFGNSRLILQTDGNLVIYAIDSGRAAWSFSPNPGTIKAYFQVDGNLVLYRADNTASAASNTANSCNNAYRYPYLAFQQDGNLVIYCRYADGTGQYSIWSTNTWIH